MSEDFGRVTFKTFASSDAIAAADAIKDCIVAAVGGFWELDPAIIAPAAGEVALRPKQQVFSPSPSIGDPNNQRIAIQGLAGGILKIGYAADGWDAGATNFAAAIATSTNTFTGMRNITGTTTGIGAIPTIATVVQYRDGFSQSSPLPGSTLSIFLGTKELFSYGAHAGRGIAMDNYDDFSNGLFGDCLFVGILAGTAVTLISGTGTTFSWLRGMNNAGGVNASVVRNGNTAYNYCRVVDGITGTDLNDNYDVRRLLPYVIHGFGKALPAPGDLTTHCGVLGTLKYIRENRSALNFQAFFRSATPNSDQRWKPMVYDATDRTQVSLWGPEVEVI